MTKHSKNNTAHSVYTYHERKKDCAKSGYGSLKERLTKDSVKDFDCCSISLHPCKNPVLSPDGYLFEKEAILEYILKKKNEIKQKVSEYEKQCNKERLELEELGEAEQRAKYEKFIKSEGKIDTTSQPSSSSTTTNGKTNSKKLPSFWIPALTPSSGKSKLQAPDKTVYCPMSGKPIRMKDLVPVKFTRIEEEETGAPSIEAAKERYKCPVTGDALGNNVPCALLRTTGDVVTMECVELIKKDMTHPLNGSKLTEKDIIPLHRGGTGFASVNVDLVVKKARPVMQV